jgi:hypothetical protein
MPAGPSAHGVPTEKGELDQSHKQELYRLGEAPFTWTVASDLTSGNVEANIKSTFGL